MQSEVKKWGNSLGLRIPKKIATKLKLKEGSSINMNITNDQLVISTENSELDILVTKINDQNSHKQMFSDNSVGKEIW
jgi:antitoxin MazE